MSKDEYIRQYSIDGRFIAGYESLRDLKEICHVSLASTSSILHGMIDCCERKVSGPVAGYYWRYADDDEFCKTSEAKKAIEIYRAKMRVVGRNVSKSEWRPLENFGIKLSDGSWKYEISTNGEVHEFDIVGGNRMAMGVAHREINIMGEHMVRLYSADDMFSDFINVGLEMAKIFIPNPLGCERVRYLNKNSLDVRIQNIAWLE